MRDQSTPAPDALIPSWQGVLIAEGWGTRLYVQHGLLVLEDGEGPAGRRVVISRARAKGLRVVLLGRAGMMSVEALRWIADAGASFAIIDAAAGRIVGSSADIGLDDARLRRAQVLAGVPPSPVGIELARYLIGSKVAGHLSVLERSFPERTAEARSLRYVLSRRIPKAPSVEALVMLESACAATYWSCWPDVEIRFARKDAKRIPHHWTKFGTRTSALTGGPRLATSAGNAALNYLTALAEIETRAGLLALGADPGLGVVHLDAPNRDSFALDLLEVLRPELEAFLLDLLDSRVFAKSDFHETERGVLRVGARLARQLADTLPEWRRLVAPHAEHVVGLIASSSPRRLRVPSKLTQAKRSAGRDPYRKSTQRARTRKRVAAASVPNACRECGEVLRSRSRKFCEACSVDQRLECVRAVGRAALSAMRARGEEDPARTPAARAKLGATQARHARERAEWELAHPAEEPDPAVWAEIVVGLAAVPVERIAREIGVSVGHAWRLRKGERRAHVRHWEALAALAQPESVDAVNENSAPRPNGPRAD